MCVLSAWRRSGAGMRVLGGVPDEEGPPRPTGTAGVFPDRVRVSLVCWRPTPVQDFQETAGNR